eukprot:scaffold7639_cov258-Pinguiococcus_pyrenoidosus.AAC.4
MTATEVTEQRQARPRCMCLRRLLRLCEGEPVCLSASRPGRSAFVRSRSTASVAWRTRSFNCWMGVEECWLRSRALRCRFVVRQRAPRQALPPSHRMLSPVRNCALSLARNAMRWPISSAVATEPLACARGCVTSIERLKNAS